MEAIAYHHAPEKCLAQSFSPLTAVHVANALEQEGRSGNGEPGPGPLNAEYLAGLGLTDRIEAWRQACRCLADKGGGGP